MTDIEQLLGKESQSLLTHTCRGIRASELHLPGPDYIDRVVSRKNRKPLVLRNLANLYQHGRLAGTDCLSILPVDQGVEHSAGAFAPNPEFFDSSRRKAFQKPMREGIELLNAIQDIYLDHDVTIA